MMYSLETIGAGEMLWTLFNAIAALLRPDGGSLIQSFIILGTVIGAVASLWYTVFQNTFRPFLSWFISTQVIILGLFAPVATIHIKDVLTGFQRTVDNVPFALAFTASTLSSVGTGVTKVIERVFQPAPNYVGGAGFQLQSSDQLAYSQTGFMFAASVMAQMKGVQISNDDMMDNMKEFVNQCVVYDALIGTKYTLHDLKRSNDIWGLVSTGASELRGFAWRDVTRGANGEFVGSAGTTIITCKAGVDKFNDMWIEARTSLVTEFQDKVRDHCGFGARTTSALSNAIAMNLPGALNKLTHSARLASEQLQQQVMISSILLANDRKSIELGGSPNLDVRRAYLQQRNTLKTTGEATSYTLPSLKNVFEALVYALFIFVVMVCMMPNGWKTLAFYLKIMLWLQLWPPLFAILNFIMTEILSSSTASALGTSSGITIANMVGLSNIANDMAATAGYLTVSIPILSWVLIELGGYAFVSMVSGVLGVSQSAASGAALEKTTGNYSAGGVTLESTQAFNSNMLKNDTSLSYTGGHFASNEGKMSKTVTSDGETILRQAESQMPVDIRIQESRDEILRDAYSTADALQTSNSQSASDSTRTAASKYLEFGKQASQQRASGVSFEKGDTINVVNEAADYYEELKNISEKYGITEALVHQKALTMQGGVSVSFGVGHLGAEYQQSMNAQATAEKATDELNQLGKSTNFREAMSHMSQASINKSFNTTDQNLNQLVNNVSGSFEKSKSYEHQANKAREVSESIQKERAHNQTFGARVDTNVTQEWVNHVGADKISAMPTREMHRSASQFAEEKVDAYRQSVAQKFDAAGLKQGMDEKYKTHSLRHNEHDVNNAYNGVKVTVRDEAVANKFALRVDESTKAEAEQMIAVNNVTLIQRGSTMKGHVQKASGNFLGQVKEHARENLGNGQNSSAINMYREGSKRNSEN